MSALGVETIHEEECATLTKAEDSHLLTLSDGEGEAGGGGRGQARAGGGEGGGESGVRAGGSDGRLLPTDRSTLTRLTFHPSTTFPSPHRLMPYPSPSSNPSTSTCHSTGYKHHSSRLMLCLECSGMDDVDEEDGGVMTDEMEGMTEADDTDVKEKS
jgi:hypothetical protein